MEEPDNNNTVSSSVGTTRRCQQDPNLGVVNGLADACGYWILQTANFKEKEFVAISWAEERQLSLWRW